MNYGVSETTFEHAIIILFCNILSISYYDDTTIDAVSAGGIDAQGNIRGWGGGKMPAILLVAIIAGLIIIPMLLRKRH